MPRKATLKTLKNKAWSLLSEIIRRGSADQNGNVRCYTCGAIGNWRDYDAGHGVSGRRNGVLFDERVIRVQCRVDNRYRGGLYEIFVPKLIQELGLTHEEWLTLVAELKSPLKMSRTDYEDLIRSYRERLKGLA